MKKISIAFALVLLLLFSGAAAETTAPMPDTSGLYLYTVLENGTAEITAYLGKAAHVQIPDRVDGHVVAGLGAEVFKGMRRLESIELPPSLRYIGTAAFYDCTALTRLTLREGAPAPVDPPIAGDESFIGDKAFWNCERLKSLTLPDSITAIGRYAFADCESLKSLTLPGSLTLLGESAFAECEALSSITLPHGVTVIGDGAFYECEALRSITLPDSVTTIGDRAFEKRVTCIVSPASYAHTWCRDNGIPFTLAD